MNSETLTRWLGRNWFASSIIAGLAALTGVGLLIFPLGSGVARLSYDLPFGFRPDVRAEEVVLVYLDEVSHAELKQPLTAPWDRTLHARLVDRLVAAGARAVVFDILFTGPSASSQADGDFTRAIENSGRVFLSGNFNHRETTPGAAAKWMELPFAPFRAKAVGWGSVNLMIDPDFGARRFFPNLENLSGETNVAWLPWAVARQMAGPAQTGDPRDSASHWLNYYGPPGSLPSVSYFLALMPDGVPPGFFKDKVVFIGAQLSADFSGKGKDEFATPFSAWGAGFSPGVEIHATAFLNLVRGDWLARLPFAAELLLILLVAALGGFGLVRFHPLPALGLTLLGIGAAGVSAYLLMWKGNVWFGWVILVLEFAVALLCSVVYNSLKLYVDKRVLEESLSSHLSPQVVKRLLADPSLRKVGGAQQEVSILFTDVANFTRISETMHPADLVRMMNKYFETALQCIHETDGTVVKLIGDAIFAIWNAPVEQADHRERACRTALLLRERIVEFETAHLSLPLRTRVGIHAGEACVGNIGSSTRFDYTALGDSINLTSRLEGLNKQLATSVLVTREVQRAVDNSLVWRLVGHFQFKGLGRVEEVYELVGPSGLAEESRVWREEFVQALQEFRLRRFAAAAVKFRRTIELRRIVQPEYTAGTGLETSDGPSRFYLKRIEELQTTTLPTEWMGEIELREK